MRRREKQFSFQEEPDEEETIDEYLCEDKIYDGCSDKFMHSISVDRDGRIWRIYTS